MKRLLLTSLLFFLCAGIAQAQLPWLEGHWVGENSEEVWSDSKGKTMLGYHRQVESGQTVFWEFLKLTSSEQGVFYWALPSGQKAVDFEMKQRTASWALFINEKHDFPTHIRYQRIGDKLEVKVWNKERKSSWSLRKK